MKWKSTILRPIARSISHRMMNKAESAVAHQAQLMKELVSQAAQTTFGKDHDFTSIFTHQDFVERIPIRDYEELRPYFDRILQGERDVTWPGIPRYLAKTSGTTSGTKYIPISRSSVSSHFGTARNAVFHYAAQTGNFDIFDGKMIFLSGSPELEEKNGILTGRLSGISNHLVPRWLRTNQLPSYDTNCIEDWERKVDQIVIETANQDLRLISGIPPWVQMYFERLLAYTGKSSVRDVFPRFSLFVYGGVNYEPYRASLEQLIGFSIDSLETYPASEGFIAFQDQFPSAGLLLNTHAGMFFEFVKAGEIFDDCPCRYTLAEVEMDVNYAVIINSNAGLWAYNIGDTVRFTSLSPHRIVVTGRIKHFISAFGEHVIGEEVERAMLLAGAHTEVRVLEFTVAPQVSPADGSLPHHEWWVEFEEPPANMKDFAVRLDEHLKTQNSYYREAIEGGVLRPLVLRTLPKGSFRKLMKKRGKLGGQNKVPRLSNDRTLADELAAL